MPNIREYTAPVDKINPTETGAAAFELEGRHVGADIGIAGRYIGGAISTVGQEYERHQNIQDVSALTQQASKSTLALDDAWNETLSNATPDTDLHALRDQFLQEQVGKHAEDLLGAAKTDRGREYAQRWAENTTNQFGRSATADIMNAAGTFAVQGLKQVVTDQGSRAYNNPENLDDILQFADGSVSHIKDSHDLKGPKGATFDEAYQTQERPKIIGNAMKGALTKNPQAFLNSLEAGQWDKYGISANEKATLTDAAERAVNRQKIQDRADEEYQDRKASKSWDAAAAQLAGDFLDGEKGSPTYGQERVPSDAAYRLNILKTMPGAKEGVISALEERMTRIQKGENSVSTNPHVWDSLFGRSQLDPHDPHFLTVPDVIAAEHAKQISTKDATALMETMRATQADKPYRQALTEFKRFIGNEQKNFPVSDPVTSFRDDTATDRYNAYRSSAQDRFDQVFRANGDWRALLDPNSPQYIGSSRGAYGPGSPVGVHARVPEDQLQRDMPLPGATQTYQGSTYRFKGGDRRKQENWEKVK